MTSPPVPPQAITAAAEGVWAYRNRGSREPYPAQPDLMDTETATVALEAALPHLAAAERDATVDAMYAGAAKAVENAVAAEREACAQLVDDRAAEINGKGCGSEVEELWRIAALLREARP